MRKIPRYLRRRTLTRTQPVGRGGVCVIKLLLWKSSETLLRLAISPRWSKSDKARSDRALAKARASTQSTAAQPPPHANNAVMG